MSKTNKTVAVVVGGKVVVGAVEDQARYGNDVVRDADGYIVAFTSHSGVFGTKTEWFSWVDRKLTKVEATEVAEVVLVDLATADLDALLG